MTMSADSPNWSDLMGGQIGYPPRVWGREARVTRRGGPRRMFAGLRDQLSLKPRRLDILIIVAYIVITRVGTLSAEKLGVHFGPVPLFITDIALLGLLMVSLFKRGGLILFWSSAGQKAGAAGLAVWALCVAGIVYFIFAFPIYHLLAVRDLAIFEYSLFFPLTYFAVDNRIWAQRITRYFIYSGVVLGILILIQFATGVDIGFGSTDRMVLGHDIAYVGFGDDGGILAVSLMGLIAYALMERERRLIQLGCALLCFVAMAATGTRSALIGAVVAALVTFFLLSHRHRLAFVVVAISFCATLLAGAALPETIPGVKPLHDFYLGLTSAAGGATDVDGAFRIDRWKDAIDTWRAHPWFGVGFGRDILHQVFIGEWTTDMFNLGMPHNTYLFLLARVGLLGFGLVMFAMMVGLWKLGLAVRQYRQPDDVAALNALIVMIVFAGFVLFFERPIHNAAFWIMLAVAIRLAQTSRSAAIAAARGIVTGARPRFSRGQPDSRLGVRVR